MTFATDPAGTKVVTLSERNLRTLLLKLEREDSARTIFKVLDDGTVLYVRAESNVEHYGDRTPGEMHPAEEAKLEMNWRRVFRDGKTAA